jgi:LysR family transcriptional regulator (chromosome initiation inhibitor)
MGYGMIPQIQASHWLDNGGLVNLAPGHELKVPLYWHFWRHSGELLQRLTTTLEGAITHHYRARRNVRL